MLANLTPDEEAQVRAAAATQFALTPGAGTTSAWPAVSAVLADPFAPFTGLDAGGALAPSETPGLWLWAVAGVLGVSLAAFMLWGSARVLAGR